jgi:hypothetical protein
MVSTRTATIILLASITVAAGCGDDGGGGGSDAQGSNDAAGTADASTAADAEACANPIAVADDGTGIAADLVLAEIAPGEHIELLNTTGQPIALSGVAHQLCSPFLYATLSSLGPDVVVPPGGLATIPWPSSFNDTDSGGEVILYKDGNFNTDESIIDFVCWGSNPHGTRKSQAEAVGKWSGGCAPAITGGAIHRVDSSDGTAAASYDVASAPSPDNCE